MNHLAPCSTGIILRKEEKNIFADLQISQIGSFLRGEHEFVYSVLVVRFTIGLYQFVPTDL